MKRKCLLGLLIASICMVAAGCSTNTSTQAEIEIKQERTETENDNSGLEVCDYFHFQEGHVPMYAYDDEDAGKVYVVTANLNASDIKEAFPLFVFSKKEDGKYKAPVRITSEMGSVAYRTICMDKQNNLVYFNAINTDDERSDGIYELYKAELDGFKLVNIQKVDTGLDSAIISDVDDQGNLYVFEQTQGTKGNIYKLIPDEKGYQKEKIETGLNGTETTACYCVDGKQELVMNAFYDKMSKTSIVKRSLKDEAEDQEIALPDEIDDSYVISASLSSKENYVYFVAVDSPENIFDMKLYKIPTDSLLNNDAPVFPTYEARSFDQYDTASFEMNHRNKGDIEDKRGIYYEIFVRSFADSDGDGIGDFNGITAKMDYLEELGIDGIWLMPVNASPSYHGYDIVSYDELNSDYGTEKDFQTMIDEAHKHGIKVIMDFVVNHTSSEHPWFKAALQDENSPYMNYYRWVNKDDLEDFNRNEYSPWNTLLWHKAGMNYYYGIFDQGMPDLNYNNPEVRKEIKTAAQKWLNMGVDGFRLDAAIHIYGQSEFSRLEDTNSANLQWWNEFALVCEEVNPNVYLVGEAWSDNEMFADYVQPFDTKFNFSMEQELIEAVKKNRAVSNAGSKPLAFYLDDILKEYEKYDDKYLDGIFGTNHDQNRIMSEVETEEKARLVAAVYLTLPGNPFIYYGEEIGMKGEKPDECIREPFKWTEDGSGMDTKWETNQYNKDTKSLEEQMLSSTNTMYHYYSTLIQFRKEHSAVWSGDYEPVAVENNSIMAYRRYDENEDLFIFHNFSDVEVSIDYRDDYGKNIAYQSDEGCKIKNEKLVIAPFGTLIMNK